MASASAVATLDELVKLLLAGGDDTGGQQDAVNRQAGLPVPANGDGGPSVLLFKEEHDGWPPGQPYDYYFPGPHLAPLGSSITTAL